MSKIGQHAMDLEETFDPVNHTTKRVAVSTTVTYYYEVSWDFDIDDDDGLTSLLANGTPVDEQISGDSQEVRDLANTKVRSFNFQG